jgi:hypothetical protein
MPKSRYGAGVLQTGLVIGIQIASHQRFIAAIRSLQRKRIKLAKM